MEYLSIRLLHRDIGMVQPDLSTVPLDIGMVQWDLSTVCLDIAMHGTARS